MQQHYQARTPPIQAPHVPVAVAVVAEGMASRSGSVLKFMAKDSGNRCNATLTVNGCQVVVDEGDGCGFFHGAACGFSAKLNRVK